MTEVFKLASNISTPLALGGFFAAILFWTLRQILAKDLFPRLNAAIGAEILKLIIERLFMLALIAMVLGFVGYIVVALVDKKPIAEEFPPRFSEIKSAELRISEVDDLLRLSVNGVPLPDIVFGEISEPISILPLLRKGTNSLSFAVDNGKYGGCGAKVELWINSRTASEFNWHWWKDIERSPANGNCYTFVKALFLSAVTNQIGAQNAA